MVTGVGMDVVRDLSGAATGSLVSAIWQGALLAGAAALSLRMLPKTPAAVRFAIWFGVFVVIAALPFAGVWAHPAAAHHGPAGSHGVWVTLDDRWSEAVILVWAAVSLVRLGSLVVGAVRVRSLWKRATPMEVGAGSGAGDWQNAFGRTIQICASAEVDRPSVIGFFAPKILIPTWLVEKLTPEEMAQVVLHEAGHLRRGDDWLNLLQKFALVLFPLNPALAWVERRLCFERELACDEQVLSATGAPKAYASCLASLAEHQMTRRGMALVMGALGRESDLGQRVRRILARGEHMRPAHARLVMGGAVCALLAGAAGLEHCPQLVGFSDISDAVVANAAAGRAAGYPDVIYRPGAPSRVEFRAVNTAMRQPMAAANPVPRAAKVARSRAGVQADQLSTGAALHATVSQGRQIQVVDRTSADRRHAAQGRVATQWVVMTSMTSWSAENTGYGARVVMTSIGTGPALQPSPNAPTLMQRDDRDALAAARAGGGPALEQVPAVQEFSPYAAVPVRGGWLVIQL